MKLRPHRIAGLTLWQFALFCAGLAVLGVMIWQGLAEQGAPDPLRPHSSPMVVALDIGILVFREGLECILVLAAITASMTGAKQAHRKPVALGAALAFVATLVTWFIATAIMSELTESVPALDLQAATGLLAILVLLVIMNWFFHKIYWGGWIRAHNRRRKSLLENADAAEISKRGLLWGLILLGFTSLYREGFEVVLFLQSYNLRLGGAVVLKGALMGLSLTAVVAVLTFVLQQRLPYRRMLITTGVLLGVVLLVMVGEQTQEMQLANWVSKTEIPWLTDRIPAWVGMWFAVFPNWEGLIAQALAAVLVIGSYYGARHFQGTEGFARPEPAAEPAPQAAMTRLETVS
ncbi:MAG TPA: FTR1 family protein [Chthoniobacterales bacterium]|nr:FTR1 family protein [Chthoniobacterales bacterium]